MGCSSGTSRVLSSRCSSSSSPASSCRGSIRWAGTELRFIIQTTEPSSRRSGGSSPDRHGRLLGDDRPARAVRADALAPWLTPRPASPSDLLPGRVRPCRGRRRRGAPRPRRRAAVEGAANQALLRLLADELGVARRSVRLVAGAAVARSWSSSRASTRGAPCPLAGPSGMIGAEAAAVEGPGRLAQWLEHAVHIRGVTGSNPVSPTITTSTDRARGPCFSVSRCCVLVSFSGPRA